MMGLASTRGKAWALAQLAERRKKYADGKHKVDNSSLRAGSPMYYYCKSCSAMADILPEDWDPHFRQPKKLCEECQALKDCGWLE